MTTIRKTAAIAALLLAAGIARAAPPRTITYSGFLLDGSGAPVGTYSPLTFTLYTDPVAATSVYNEQITVLPSSADGYFSVTLGLTKFMADAVFDAPLYLGVKYGSEAEMTPRVPISSVPSAFSVLSVDWSIVKNRPASSCSGATPYVTGINENGVAICGASPGGSGGCGSGQVLKWSGSAWACAADVDTTYTASAPLVLTGTTLSIGAATASADGYLAAADWVAFNAKLADVAVAAPLTGNGTAGSPVTLAQASGSSPGYLAAADWNTFNGKLGAVTASTPLSGSGTSGSPLVIAAANGSTGGYLTSADFNTFANKVSAVGVATNGGLVVSGTTNPALSLSTSCSDGQVLRWNAAGPAWGCSPALGTAALGFIAPVQITGNATQLTVSMVKATSSADGYLTSTDWQTFNAKAPTASPTFTGVVTAPTFSGALSGNATTATTASAVVAGSITPSDLSAGSSVATVGKAPLRSATDAFNWVTPVTTVAAGSGITVTGSAPQPTVSVSFAGAGAATTAARSDHTHAYAPIAWGSVGPTGTIYNAGSGNWTVTWNATSLWYEINITGVAYSFSLFTTTVTPYGGPYIPGTSSVSNMLLVYLYNSAGTKVQASFGFVVLP